MADYFTHFSCLFDVGTPENIARALDLYRDAEPNEDGWRPSEGFSMSLIDADGPKLWIRDEDNGSPDLVIEFVLLCAEKFDLKGLWGFTWANTCSKPRPGAFDGSAVVIDLGARKSSGYVNTGEWLGLALEGGDPDA